MTRTRRPKRPKNSLCIASNTYQACPRRGRTGERVHHTGERVDHLDAAPLRRARGPPGHGRTQRPRRWMRGRRRGWAGTERLTSSGGADTVVERGGAVVAGRRARRSRSSSTEERWSPVERGAVVAEEETEVRAGRGEEEETVRFRSRLGGPTCKWVSANSVAHPKCGAPQKVGGRASWEAHM